MSGIFVGQKTGWSKQEDKRQQNKAVDNCRQQNLSIAIIDLEQGILNGDLVAQIDKGIDECDGNKSRKTAHPDQLKHILPPASR